MGLQRERCISSKFRYQLASAMARADIGLRNENENVMQLRFDENASGACIDIV